MSRPPVPPFTRETAIQKVRAAEDAWNTRDPARVPAAYTADSRWRNRDEFFAGRAAIEAFLQRKWAKELDYRLIKELGRFRTTASRCASSTSCTTRPASGGGATATRCGSSTPRAIWPSATPASTTRPSPNSERLFRWPPGRRPDAHPGLAELGL